MNTVVMLNCIGAIAVVVTGALALWGPPPDVQTGPANVAVFELVKYN